MDAARLQDGPARAGTQRSHGCSCEDLCKPSVACPAHAAWDQQIFLQSRFKDRWHQQVPDPDLPFFPKADGSKCSKDGITQTLIEAAKLLKAPFTSSTERISGHSMRVTGAQGLATAGLDLWAIQLLGRWGSDAVRLYVRDAYLASSATWASRVARSQALDDLARSIGRQGGTRVTTERLSLTNESAANFTDSLPYLLQNVKEDMACALALEATAACTSSEDKAFEVVINAEGKVHAVLISPSVSLAQASTVCGWRFGRANARVAPFAQAPSCHKQLCAKCFPSLRMELKEKLAAAVRIEGGLRASPPRASSSTHSQGGI